YPGDWSQHGFHMIIIHSNGVINPTLLQATLVIEADLKSGSLITAGQATQYGRDVLAVPGSVLNKTHAGCHQLIRDGAQLVESADDLLKLLSWHSPSKKHQSSYHPANDHEVAIITLLEQEILHLDALADTCNLTVPVLSPILLALELQGVIERLPGSRYTLGGEHG
ncbi:MAG: DNA-processing protein DprA, partial [Mariprofundaceae bacterium]